MFLRRDPELKRRIELARVTQITEDPSLVLRDPIELDEETAPIIEEVLARADRETDPETAMGRCHHIWSLARKILRDEYDITWYSPQQMNPDHRFD